MMDQVPNSFWEAFWQIMWPAAAEFFTPSMLGAFFAAWALTHGIKLVAAAFFPKFACEGGSVRWKAITWLASLAAGFISGVFIFLPYGAGWLQQSMAVAVLNGFVWKAVYFVMPAPVKRAMTTPTDRKFSGGKGNEG